MDAIRINRIQAAMKDELSVLINRQLKDPRVPTVVVTDVELTRDAKQATVKISVLSMSETHSKPEVMAGCLDALNHAKGWLKRQLSELMALRAMPELIFKEDKGLENTLRVDEILKQLAAEKSQSLKADRNKDCFMHGAFIVQKPTERTSTDCVNKIKWTLVNHGYSDKKIKIGHGGTLDPFATGVLIVLFGEATKLADTYLHSKKAYSGLIALGAKTDTADWTGSIVVRAPVPTLNTGEWQKLASSFTEGDYLQTPPMYSAKKKDGVAFHELARQGIEIDRIAILKKIYSYSVRVATDGTEPALSFEVECESGTYVRTLAEDLAKKAGTFAHLKTLCRTRSSDCAFDQGLPLDQILRALEQKTALAEILAYRPLSTLGSHLPSIEVSADHAPGLRSGNIRFTEPLCESAFLKFPDARYVLAKISGQPIALLSHESHQPYRVQRIFNEVSSEARNA